MPEKISNKSENKIIITVSGVDQIGIVAKVANVLADYRVNIEDIKQSLMQDYFVMFLLGDISQAEKSFKEIKEAIRPERSSEWKFGFRKNRFLTECITFK